MAERFGENWEEVRGHVRNQWTNLTDTDLDTINGDYERLIAIVSDKHDMTKDEAHSDFMNWYATMEQW